MEYTGMSKAVDIASMLEVKNQVKIPKNKVKAKAFDDGHEVTLFAGVYDILGDDAKDKTFTIVADDTGDLFLVKKSELQKYKK